MTIRSGGDSFGFTGESNYFIDEPVFNEWTFGSEFNFSMGRAEGFGAAPPIGFFFAPTRAGSIDATNRYATQIQPAAEVARLYPVQGIGVADSEATPALTLDVELLGEPASVKSCSDGTPQCTEVAVPDRVTFAVTPRVDASLLPPNVEPIQHAYVQLIVDESSTPCSVSNPTFRDRGLTQNSFTFSDYFHYLEVAGPNNSPLTCLRVYTFLASIGKTFQFEARTVKDTGNGFADYHFSLRGHLDRNNATRWPGSQPRFRLTRDGTFVQPNSPPFASFTAINSGTNSFSLDATTSTDSDGTISSYQWSASDGTFVQQNQSNPALATVSFSNVNTAGIRTITLVITDDDGSTGQTTRTVSVAPIDLTQTTAAFTPTPSSGEAPLTVLLDCTASTLGGGATSLGSCAWQSSDGMSIPDGFTQSVQFNTPGTYNVTLTVTDNLGSTDAITRSIEVLAPVNTPVENRLADFTVFTRSRSDVPFLLSNKGVSPLTVRVIASEPTDTEMRIVSYAWSSSDGQTLNELNNTGNSAEITFNEEGLYAITLIVEDANGDNESISKVVEVVDRLPPVASISGTVTAIENADTTGFDPVLKTTTLDELATRTTSQELFLPTTVLLDGLGSYAHVTGTNNGITSYIWRENGVLISDASTLTRDFVLEPFEESRTFDISLTVVDASGQNTTTKSLLVRSQPLNELGDLTSLPGAGNVCEAPFDNLVDAFCRPGVPDNRFTGGVRASATGEVFNQDSTDVPSFVGGQEVDVLTRITPLQAHIGQSADIIVVAAYTPENGQPAFFMKTSIPFAPFIPWDLDFGTLESAQEVVLGENLEIPALLRTALPPANYLFFIGYRLKTDGNLVIGETPITFTITSP